MLGMQGSLVLGVEDFDVRGLNEPEELNEDPVVGLALVEFRSSSTELWLSDADSDEF